MDFAVSVNLPLLLPAGSPLPTVFPTLAEAVRAVAVLAQEHWVAYAMGATLPDGRAMNPNAEYARSITVRQTGDLAWRVETNYDGAEAIEEGSRGYDMKRALNSSLKVRLNKRGQRYLIIPFRHGTPGSVTFQSVMPPHVHELARALSASRFTGRRTEPNQIGVHDLRTHQLKTVTRRTYSYGEKLPAGLVGKLRLHHKTDPFAGMYRFDAPSGGHSRFMTFRTMGEWQSGSWIRGARPGYWLARTVAEQVTQQAQPVFEAAAQRDIQNLLAGR